MYKCVICHQVYNDHVAAQSGPGCSGGNHILQEVIEGAWNDDRKERADFIAADERDLREWAEKARKLGYTIDD